MNIKLKTLILSIIVVFIIAIAVDSKASIEETLSLITFIMIFHVYLSEHYNNIEEIENSIAKDQASKFEVRGVTEENAPENDENANNENAGQRDNVVVADKFDEPSDYLHSPPVGGEEVVFGSDQLKKDYYKPLTFNETTFKTEDDRMKQELQRFKPEKNIHSREKMYKNIDKFKALYNDELKYEESRVWWEDSQPKKSTIGGFRLY